MKIYNKVYLIINNKKHNQIYKYKIELIKHQHKTKKMMKNNTI